ncbi:MAG: hypothetical protein ACJ76Y_27655 [Thermoanaerobaculia bacterium]
MCRVFRLVLLGALLALPLSAAQKTEPSLSAFLQTLSPAATAQAKTICPLSQPSCCEPDVTCNTDYTSVEFLYQKANGVCVYRCGYTDTCYDSCGHPSSSTSGFFRVRGQFQPGGCPAADISFCSTMVVDP